MLERSLKENHWGTAAPPQSKLLTSELCKMAHFPTDWYIRWCSRIREMPRKHRKQWEYAYILQVLFERGYLREGSRGLGFAVGTEPLPAVMASFGCEVLATDLDYEEGRSLGWDSGDQLCAGIASLNQRGICDNDVFRKLVRFTPVNMNSIPTDLRGFDFNWSSCSFEHLGSIDKGLAFLRNQLDTLKVGGLAVHTTEYNVSSETDTVEHDPNTVIFRRSDLEAFAEWAEQAGHVVEQFDFSLGNHPLDFHVDTPPYVSEPHTRLLLHGYVATSVGIIIRKGKKGIQKGVGKFFGRLINNLSRNPTLR